MADPEISFSELMADYKEKSDQLMTVKKTLELLLDQIFSNDIFKNAEFERATMTIKQKLEF